MGKFVSITGLRNLPPALQEPDVLCIVKKSEKWFVEPVKTVFGEQDSNYLQVCAAFRTGRWVNSVPSYFVLIKDALVSPAGVVFTRNGDVVYESLAPWQLENYHHQFKSSILTEGEDVGPNSSGVEPEEVDTALHFREGGETGYFHFINSVLPKLALSSYISLQGNAEYLVNTHQHFARDIINIVNINSSDYTKKWTRCRTLVYFSPFTFQGDHFTRPRFGSDLLKSIVGTLVAPHRGGPMRRIYLTRDDASVRRLQNEQKIIEILGRHGFETLTIGSMPIEEQIAIFANTSHLVSAHGAGLSNMIFMPENSIVTELVSPARLWPTFRMLAARHGVQYHAVIGDAFQKEQTGHRGDGNEDFTCDADMVNISLRSVYY